MRVNQSEYRVWCQCPMQLDLSGMKRHKESAISSQPCSKPIRIKWYKSFEFIFVTSKSRRWLSFRLFLRSKFYWGPNGRGELGTGTKEEISEFVLSLFPGLMTLLRLFLVVVRFQRTKNNAERIVHVESILRRGRFVPGDGQVRPDTRERRSLMGISIISILPLNVYTIILLVILQKVVIMVQNNKFTCSSYC
jgi:hypothetical protein